VLDDAAPTAIAVAEDADARHLANKAEILRVPRSHRGVDLHAVLEALHTRGVRCLFLEGGPTLAGSFVASNLIDRVVGYIAPAFLGAGKSALMDAGIGTIADAVRLELLHLDRSGPDVRLVARLLRR
jgi:diaminohydroxyphosphoribosylaminopyrimidine deaminase/5-amino-6-(5-phosphoribosylamino)uracil reductase